MRWMWAEVYNTCTQSLRASYLHEENILNKQFNFFLCEVSNHREAPSYATPRRPDSTRPTNISFILAEYQVYEWFLEN